MAHNGEFWALPANEVAIFKRRIDLISTHYVLTDSHDAGTTGSGRSPSEICTIWAQNGRWTPVVGNQKVGGKLVALICSERLDGSIERHLSSRRAHQCG